MSKISTNLGSTLFAQPLGISLPKRTAKQTTKTINCQSRILDHDSLPNQRAFRITCRAKIDRKHVT